ncbi:MAG TPA: HNH endonuclease signature motif containing protein [Anaerolineales bacterium]|nr:HNH endonuclease signature motif containing protein [Anaerolineales bacterium]
MFKKWPNRKYCSRKCLGIAQRKEEKQCLSCGISYVGSGKKFCSKKCQSSFMVKERSPTWKGGINKEKDRRKSFEGVKWRKAVFERDDYTCRMCGKKGGFIEADHIKPFCDYPELRYELSNGRTLCRGCHRGTDTYGRKRRFIEYNGVRMCLSDWSKAIGIKRGTLDVRIRKLKWSIEKSLTTPWNKSIKP